MAKSKKLLVLSSGRLNRKSYWVVPAGIDYSDFNDNPVLLAFHEGEQLPIGRVEDIQLLDGKLVGTPNFDSDDPIAAEFERKYEAGFLNACSIRHIPSETSTDKKHLKPGQQRATVLKCSLIEVSMVTIPADAGATKLSESDEANIDTIIPILNYLKPDHLKMDKDFSIVLSLLGLSTTATPAEAVTSITKLKVDLEAANKTNVDNLLSIGKANGTITDDNEATYRKLAMNSYDEVKALIGEPKEPDSKPVEQLSIKATIDALKSSTTTSTISEEKGVSFDKLSKENSDQLNEIRLTKPDTYALMAKEPEKLFEIA